MNLGHAFDDTAEHLFPGRGYRFRERLANVPRRIGLRVAGALRHTANCLDPSAVNEQHAYEAGYRTAAHEIAIGCANYKIAKERDIHDEDQNLRIKWDRGYDAAVCAYRLGHDPAGLARAGVCVESAMTMIGVIESIEAGRPLRLDPRRRA